MSHFTSIKTKIYEEATLRDIIKGLGYRIVEDKELRGFAGVTQIVDFQVDTGSHYNIGFKKVDRNYEMIADRFMNPNFEAIKTNILQGYAQRIVDRNVQALGYTQVKRTVDKDKTIRLVLVKR